VTRTHLLTGAGSGIGELLARALLERGDEVLVVARSAQRAEEITAALPGARPLVADLASPGDAEALDRAGAFAIVIEGVVEPIAIAATEAVSCPTIGIGASARCDGQVLVAEDMLGMFERVPRFVKKYEDLAGIIEKTAAKYAEEVRARRFPGEDQTYQPKA